MDMASWCIAKTGCTKDNGKTTTDVAREWKGTQMATNTRAILSKERHTEKEFITGQMEKFMMGSGKME